MLTDASSSIITGDSTQINLEGQWDESIPLESIHEGIVEYLVTKLERLKATYKGLKMKSRNPSFRNREDLVMKKIVTARLNYQRYMAVTKDILSRCNEFMNTRRDTPESRIAFIRNAQDYFQQARDFVKMDITFKKLSPSLIRYIEPKTGDSPEVYARKRELCKTMIGILGKEKTNQFTNGVGKLFRSRYLQQSKLFNKGFPEQWINSLPVSLKTILKGVSEEERWPRTLIFLFSNYCSRNYVHQGFCPGCYHPIINEVAHDEHVSSGGKLFCRACGKEIEWTYYINPRTIRILFSKFHTEEIEKMKLNVESIIGKEIETDEERGFDDILDLYISHDYEEEGMDGETLEHENEEWCCSQEKKRVQREKKTDEPRTTSPGSGRGRPRSESPRKVSEEYKTISFGDVIERVREKIFEIYGEEPKHSLERRLKIVYQTFRMELQTLEGFVDEEDKYPRAFLSKIENYVRYHFKLPPKEEVRLLPLCEKGGREGTNRGMIISALTELKFSKYLNYVTLICEKLWNYQKPDFSRHRDDIIYECVLQKEIFTRLSYKYGRKSNLNQQLILLFILQRYGYMWTEEDFKIKFHEDTKTKQLGIMKEIFSVIDQKKEV